MKYSDLPVLLMRRSFLVVDDPDALCRWERPVVHGVATPGPHKIPSRTFLSLRLQARPPGTAKAPRRKALRVQRERRLSQIRSIG